MADPTPPDVIGTLDALRERGAHHLDPVRFRLVESMVRRASAHRGSTRQVLDEKVSSLLLALSETVALAEARPIQADTPAHPGLPAPGELARLVAHTARHKPGGVNAVVTSAPGMAPAATRPSHDSPVDPTTLQFFRRTWSRLSADQRLAQSRSSLPDNAGPLNSQHLVHRALNVMRELSPDYFDLFISHVDTLLWLERANEQAAREVGLPPRAKGGKKAAGARRG